MFCPAHAKQLAEGVSADALRAGKQPGGQRHKPPRASHTSARDQSGGDTAAANGAQPAASPAEGGLADPGQLRPALATAASRNAGLLEKTLLEAATAQKTIWAAVSCRFCEREARYPIIVADHKVRVDAVRALLAEALGAPARAEETPAVSMPTSLAAVKRMGWEEMQYVFAQTYVDELAAVQRSGGAAALRERVSALSTGERRVLREALAETAA